MGWRTSPISWTGISSKQTTGLGIRSFGVKVEHVFHAGDIFAIDPGDAPHVLAPGLEVVFGQSPANRLMRQALVVGKLDHLASQQLQCPAGAPRRRLGAGGCHQKGFFLAGELALRSRTWLFGERPFEIALHEAPLGAIDGRASHPTVRAICSSLLPTSAANRIWARLSLRAACLPALNIAVSSSRSAWLSSTR